MNFLLPAGLFGLFALALPLLIHLVRRPPTETVPFAALRWLGDVARPQRQWQLRQWLLLLLRLLLLAALALLLAEPLRQAGSASEHVRAVSPALPAPAPAEGVRDVWLAAGFPAITADALLPAADQPTSSLLRQLDAQLAPGTTLQVMVPAALDGTDGQRPQLSRNVDWQVHAAPDAPAAKQASEPAAPRIVLRHDGSDAMRASLHVWHAVADAWQTEASADIAALDAPLPALGHAPLEQDTLLVWLADAPLPAAAQAHLASAGRVLLAAPIDGGTPALLDNGDGSPLLARDGDGRFRLARPLTPAAAPRVLEADFPARLLQALQPRVDAARADAAEHAPVSGAPALFAPTPQPLAPMLIVLIALLFVLERLLAHWPRREAA